MSTLDFAFWDKPYVLSWEVSNSLETDFCLVALERALEQGCPSIFNTDQGSQFTSFEFTKRLQSSEIEISMDGKGRALDNVFVERLWRTLKYEDIYLRDYEDGRQLREGLFRYFRFYNTERPHTALDWKTPAGIHYN
jgi:putative transposase